MPNVQGWTQRDYGARDEDGNGGMGAPGIFRPDGSFEWFGGGSERSVLVPDPDGALRAAGFVGNPELDGGNARVPLSIAQANGMQPTGFAGQDPDYNQGSFLKDVLMNGVLPAAGIIAGGSALSSYLGAGAGAAGAGAAGAASGGLDAALADGFYSGAGAANAGGLQFAQAGGALDAGAAGIGSLGSAGGGLGLSGGNAAALGMGGGAASPLGTGLQYAAGAGGLGTAPIGASLADSVLAGGGTMGGLGFAGSGGAGLAGLLDGGYMTGGYSMPPAPPAPSGGGILGTGISPTDALKYGLPLAGSLLGGMAGSQSPAGTTTTTQDVPEWQKPYIMDLMNSARQTYNAQQGNQQSGLLANAGAQNMQSTINGDYLNPSSNPYLQQTFDKAARGLTDQYNYSTMPQLSRAFGNQQAFGGNSAYGEAFGKANQGLATGLADLGTGIYGGNYQSERGRQFSAAGGAPDYAASLQTQPYAGLQAYGNIVGRSFGSQTQQPYFSNPAGGAMSGLLGGYALSNMFGK